MVQQQPPAPPSQHKKIPLDFPAQLRGGVYANNMMVVHTKEEFILDFIMVGPGGAAVTSRVITSPGHMKRMISALQENMHRYEQHFGSLAPAEEPKGHIGFLRE